MTSHLAPVNRKGKQATQRNKNKQKAAAKPIGPRDFKPAFLYITDCHKTLAKKVPLTKQDRESKTYGEGHLGKFRCSECNKHAKVSRKQNTEGMVFGYDKSGNAVLRAGTETNRAA